jgi:hypothetical protein
MDGGNTSNGHSPNGHTPEAERRHANPYAEALIGSKPAELAEFELHTDPYANMVPRVSSMVTAEGGELEPAPRRRNPIVIAVSLVLVAVLVLPVMVEVFTRLIH